MICLPGEFRDRAFCTRSNGLGSGLCLGSNGSECCLPSRPDPQPPVRADRIRGEISSARPLYRWTPSAAPNNTSRRLHWWGDDTQCDL